MSNATPARRAAGDLASDGRAPGRRILIGGLRLAVAAVVIAAVVTQLVSGLQRDSFRISNFLSYFTIESNIIGAAVMIVAAVAALRGRTSLGLSALRGAATLYMAITGLVYNLLLRGLEESLQTPIPWVNNVLHVSFPIVILLDWLLDRTVRPLPFRVGLVFLLYPLLYLAYSLSRGPIVDWYPYPFLDPRVEGYGNVALMSVLVAVIAAALAFVVCWTTRLGRAGAAPANAAGADRLGV